MIFIDRHNCWRFSSVGTVEPMVALVIERALSAFKGVGAGLEGLVLRCIEANVFVADVPMDTTAVLANPAVSRTTSPACLSSVFPENFCFRHRTILEWIPYITSKPTRAEIIVLMMNFIIIVSRISDQQVDGNSRSQCAEKRREALQLLAQDVAARLEPGLVMCGAVNGCNAKSLHGLGCRLWRNPILHY
jgi:hypothetical protein